MTYNKSRTDSTSFYAQQLFLHKGVRKGVIMIMTENVRQKIKCVLVIIGHILLIVSSLLYTYFLFAAKLRRKSETDKAQRHANGRLSKN